MDHIHTFLTTQGHGGPPRMSDQPNSGATSETAQTWKTIHIKHTLSHPNKANMERWLRRPNDIRGPWGPKVSWHMSDRWGKIPKKPHPGNCPDRGSNPGPLRDKRACYHLLHSGGLIWTSNNIKITNKLIVPHHHHQCVLSKDRQVLHCKRRNEDCSSAQRQVFHCKFRNQGCSSVEEQVFHSKLRNQGCSFTRDE